MARIAMLAVLAAWLLAGALLLRAGGRRRGRARDARWHRAQDVLRGWQPEADPVPPAVTWCRTEPAQVVVPRQRPAELVSTPAAGQ